jgi:hypothetical protein
MEPQVAEPPDTNQLIHCGGKQQGVCAGFCLERRNPLTHYFTNSDFLKASHASSPKPMRESNGPNYVRSAINHVAWVHFETIGLCFVLILLARPEPRLAGAAVELLNDPARVNSRVTRTAYLALQSESNGGAH